MEKISYRELARRVGDCILNNEIHNATTVDGCEWEMVNGNDCHCYVHETVEECDEHSDDCEEESKEIYQEYIITDSGADYLKRKTEEIVYYNDEINMYLWGITHFGTSWDGVYTEIKN